MALNRHQDSAIQYAYLLQRLSQLQYNKEMSLLLWALWARMQRKAIYMYILFVMFLSLINTPLYKIMDVIMYVLHIFRCNTRNMAVRHSKKMFRCNNMVYGNGLSTAIFFNILSHVENMSGIYTLKLEGVY